MRKTTYIMIGVCIVSIIAITVYIATFLNSNLVTKQLFISSNGISKIYVPESQDVRFSLPINNIVPVRVNVSNAPSDSSFIEIPEGWMHYVNINETIDADGKQYVEIGIRSIQEITNDSGKEIKATFSDDNPPLVINFYTSNRSSSFRTSGITTDDITLSFSHFQGDDITVTVCDTLTFTNATIRKLNIPIDNYGTTTYINQCKIDSLIISGSQPATFVISDDNEINNLVMPQLFIDKNIITIKDDSIKPVSSSAT